jgi:hypothetical protein
MAKGSSPAKRTNTGLALLLITALLGAGATALFGNTSPISSSTTAPAEPPMEEPDGASGSRPAETSYSWFDHSFNAEQFDYEMPELSCASVAKVITPDLCSVADTSYGSFMLVGSEGYWDPQEEDADGIVWVPLNLTVFTMRSDNGMPRAVSVLDGVIDKQYTANKAQVDVYAANVGGQEMLVIHKRLSKANADPYSFTEEVQVIAMSKQGAPTVVATYAGSSLRVAASANLIEISTLRYLTSAQSSEDKWFTRIVLVPNDSDGIRMDETVTSGPAPVKQGAGMKLLDTYVFPVGRGKTDTPDTSNKL